MTNKKSPQIRTLGDVVGMPDQWDYDNLKALISKYNRQYPGEIQEVVRDNRRSRGWTYNPFAASKSGHLRHALELPEGLHNEIKRSYPLMFKEKKQLHWFMRKFPEFTRADKV